MYRWIGGIAVALLLLGVGVGCGGGSGDTTPDITKAQFVKKADFICADSKQKRTDAAKELNQKQRQGTHIVGSKAYEELQAELRVIAEKLLRETFFPLMRTQQKELEALGAPAGDEEKVEQMLDNLDQAVDEVEEEGLRGLIGGDQFDQFEEEAAGYGLNCKVV